MPQTAPNNYYGHEISLNVLLRTSGLKKERNKTDKQQIKKKECVQHLFHALFLLSGGGRPPDLVMEAYIIAVVQPGCVLLADYNNKEK